MIEEKSLNVWNGASWKHLLGFFLVFTLFGTIASSEELVIVMSTVGECTLAAESNEQWRSLRLRAHHPRYQGCHIDEASMVSVLSEAFLKEESPKLEGGYSSLSTGRLIDYPWLCQYLAKAAYRDRGWDSKKGKPASMDINKYTAQLLFKGEVTAQIERVLEKGRYRVAGVTVEKVLVGGFREVPFYQGEMYPGRVPYDAQVWFRLKKN